MFFNSYEFVLLYLPLVLLGYFFIGRMNNKKIANVFLLCASIFFYVQFNVLFFVVIACSILVNYFIAKFMKMSNKKWLLLIGILFNIGVLGYFKYTNFFIENLNAILQTDFNLVHLLIPVGISFFTFQQISFIVDSYRKDVQEYPFIEYALHILFFGYIISGPIVRHNQIIPQFLDERKKVFQHENFAKGLTAFIIGLAKKVLIADTFAVIVASGYENVYGLNTASAFLLMLGYTLQIYFDFSGYSDMVTGIGKMFNIDIPINFNSPYKALTIMDFWKRWHMTLTKFFTDYVYIPLGGNRKGKYVTYFNVFMVFFISGIWHGANWTFIIWGVMHGVASIIERIFKKKVDNINPVLSWLITFAFVNIAWIFFRADTVGDAIFLIKTLMSCQFDVVPTAFINAVMLPEIDFIIDILNINITFLPNMIMGAFYLISIIVILQCKNTNERIEQLKPSMWKVVILGLVLAWCVVSFSNVTSYIYVNF